MNLQEMQDAVRTQVDVDSSELPTPTLNLYLREGFQQTVAFNNRWPSYESSWTLTAAVDQADVALPSDVDSVVSVKATDDHTHMLRHRPYQLAEGAYASYTSTGTASQYSMWGGRIYLWPTPDVETTLQVRGRRIPIDFTTGSATTEVDADWRLHLPIVHYAVSRVYAQQEDDVLAQFYLKTWSAAAQAAKDAIMASQHQGVWSMGGDR